MSYAGSMVMVYGLWVAAPLVMSAVLGAGTQNSFLYEFSRSLALAAVAMVSLQPMLVARMPSIERHLARAVLLRWHRGMGVLAAVLVLAHPFMLVAGNGPFSLSLGSVSVPWYVWAGRFTWIALVVHVGLSLFFRGIGLNFQQWRRVHVAVAPVIMVSAFVHSFWTGSDLALVPLQVLWIALVGIFSLGYLYPRVIGSNGSVGKASDTAGLRSPRLVMTAMVIFIVCAALGTTIVRAQVLPAVGRDAAGSGEVSPSGELIAKGEALFKGYCGGCHANHTREARVGPALKGLFRGGKPLADGQPVTEDSIRAQLKKPAQSMPPFEHLTEDQVEAIIAYLKTL